MKFISGYDSSYYKKFRELVKEALGNAIREYEPMKYDISSIFARNFADKLHMTTDVRNRPISLKTAIRTNVYSNETEYQIDPLNFTINANNFGVELNISNRPILEAICDHSDHSLVFIINTTSLVFLCEFTTPKPISPDTDQRKKTPIEFDSWNSYSKRFKRVIR